MIMALLVRCANVLKCTFQQCCICSFDRFVCLISSFSMLELNLAVNDSFKNIFHVGMCINLHAILELLETSILEALSIQKTLTAGFLSLGMHLHKRKVLGPKLPEGNVGQCWTNFFSSSGIGQPSIVDAHFLCLA